MSAAPDRALAETIARAATGIAPIRVERFTTGAMHYVFEAVFAERAPIVVRIAADYGHDAMRGAERLSRLLRPLGVPLPAILAQDLDAPSPYLVLERLPGTDLGDVVETLPAPALAGIAADVSRAQAIAATTPSAGRFGYAPTPETAPHARWSDVLRRHVLRSRSRIAAAGLFDLAAVDAVAALIERHAPALDRQAPTPFLHDTTTKNVIVTPQGDFSGIVDVDDLCYGDPRYVMALTLTALSAHGLPGDYVRAWMQAGGHADDALFRLYVLAFIADFMSEHGQVFNGNQQASQEAARRHLSALFAANLDEAA